VATGGASGCTFRPAAPSDATAVAAYHHRCWQRSFAPLLAPGVVAALDPSRRLDLFRAWFAPGSEVRTVVADRGGRAIGHTTVGGAELIHLFVDPDHWGGGLGRALLAIGEEMLAEAGHREVELHTIVGNEPALALYRSAGWVVTDRLVHNDTDGLVYDEHVLVKRLR
jgi:GNAT superfamily N-acetyltransferase